VGEPASAGWRTIDDLAGLVGAYCWVEHRIFEVTGSWASEPARLDMGLDELRVWCAASGRRHGALAGRWAERLPVRAGVDRVALVEAPARPVGLADSLGELAATKDLVAGVGALVATVLPWLDGIYAAHLDAASPVSEASVIETLVEARRGCQAEIKGGQSLLARLPGMGTPPLHLGKTFERSFADQGVFPAVRPS
jgi:hypothetical protein